MSRPTALSLLPLLLLWTAGSLAQAASPSRVPRESEVPSALVEALNRNDPAALADPSLPRLASLDESQRAALAERIARWEIDRKVAAWAFLQVGTPYELGPLGEDAPPDTQPVIQFRTTDCTVLNLVSAALAHAGPQRSERSAMGLANYRHGVVSYANRFHFTTDRLDSSPYFRDITRRIDRNLCRTRAVVLNHRADGRPWIPISWSRRRLVSWLPREAGDRFARWHDEGRLPDAVGVAFVQTRTFSDGLDVVHESMLWKGRTFLHASSVTGRVVTMDWKEFLAGPGSRYDGFVLFRYR